MILLARDMAVMKMVMSSMVLMIKVTMSMLVMIMLTRGMLVMIKLTMSMLVMIMLTRGMLVIFTWAEICNEDPLGSLPLSVLGGLHENKGN